MEGLGTGLAGKCMGLVCVYVCAVLCVRCALDAVDICCAVILHVRWTMLCYSHVLYIRCESKPGYTQ
jgi:hypothetical protein